MKTLSWYWNRTEYTNGKCSAEYRLVIDACKKHACVFGQHFSHYALERYEGWSDESKKAELIGKMKARDIENPNEYDDSYFIEE